MHRVGHDLRKAKVNHANHISTFISHFIMLTDAWTSASSISVFLQRSKQCWKSDCFMVNHSDAYDMVLEFETRFKLFPLSTSYNWTLLNSLPPKHLVSTDHIRVCRGGIYIYRWKPTFKPQHPGSCNFLGISQLGSTPRISRVNIAVTIKCSPRMWETWRIGSFFGTRVRLVNLNTCSFFPIYIADAILLPVLRDAIG